MRATTCLRDEYCLWHTTMNTLNSVAAVPVLPAYRSQAGMVSLPQTVSTRKRQTGTPQTSFRDVVTALSLLQYIVCCPMLVLDIHPGCPESYQYSA